MEHEVSLPFIVSPSPAPIMSQTNPLHTVLPYFCNIHINILSSPLTACTDVLSVAVYNYNGFRIFVCVFVCMYNVYVKLLTQVGL
jgi:hypothetical protein